VRHKILSKTKRLATRLSQATAAILIVLFFVFLTRKRIKIGDYSLRNYLFSEVENYNFWMFIVLCLILVCAVSVIIFVLMSVFFTKRNLKMETFQKEHSSLFTNYLVDYIFAEASERKLKKELVAKIKEITKTKKQIVILLSIFTKVQESLAVDLSQKFIFLMDSLKIRNKLPILVHSNDFSEKILAFKVLSYLRMTDYNNEIIEATKSTNYALRTEATTALIRLSKKDNLSLLIDYSAHISLLDVNIIVNAILKNFKMDVDFATLLKSKNPKIIMIGVILIKYRNSTNHNKALKSLLGHYDPNLNYEIWDTYLTVAKKDYEEVIIKTYNSQPEKVKMLILSKDLHLSSNTYCKFLVNVINEDEVLQNKVLAMKHLFTKNFKKVAEFSKSENKKITLAFNQVKDYNLQ